MKFFGFGRGRFVRRLLVWACAGVLAGTTLAVTVPGAARAADFEWVGSELCDVRMTETLEVGDLDEYKALLKANDRLIETFDGMTGGASLCLSSPGGAFGEALRIIEFHLETFGGSPTRLEPGAQCLSACALIFLSGHWQESEFVGPDRLMHVTSRLALHAPYFEDLGDRAYSSEQMAQAYKVAVQSIAELMRMDRVDLFPRSLLVETLLTEGDEWVEVDTVGELAFWRVGLYGYEAPRGGDALRVHLHRLCHLVSDFKVSDATRSDARRYSGPNYVSNDPSDPPALDDRVNQRFALASVGSEASQYCVVRYGRTALGDAQVTGALVGSPSEEPWYASSRVDFGFFGGFPKSMSIRELPPGRVGWPGNNGPVVAPASAATPSPAAVPSFGLPTSTAQIRELQRTLNALGYDAGTADGVMGPRTQAAFVRFLNDQSASGDVTTVQEVLGRLGAAR